MQTIFDISTLARSSGQAVGIVRVVRELARFARANRPDTIFVIFDSSAGLFRHVAPAHLDAVLDDKVLIDASTQADLLTGRSVDRLPRPLRGLALWLRNPRRRAFMALENMRARGGKNAALAAFLQARLLKSKHREALTGSGGERRTVLAFEAIAGAPIAATEKQVLLCPGSDWNDSAVSQAAHVKASAGTKIAQICYDTVPLLHPGFYPPGIGEQFRLGFHRMAALVDVMLVTAKQVADDVRSYCAASGLPAPRLAVFPLGADPVPAVAETALPAGLEAGRYAMLVGTIEPRKGHRLLFDVWKHLLAEGVPQRTGFKLVFLGRKGWLVDDLVTEIEADASFGDSLLILSGVSDRDLAVLYHNAAFTALPSLYEGYGLPVVESFRHGKAVLASTGGALKEVVGAFSPCLDPRDEAAWLDAMRRWIDEPASRAPYEAALRERFRHPTWPEAAAAFFAALDTALAEAKTP
jgi:glycosyltransferase involved in cell wall biosynthesis